jgi:circadian clock protein KaiC
MRIVKYRGTSHGTNEYPFLIDETGLSVLPVTSLTLQHRSSDERISSGIPRLDAMLDGHGFYRGSTILVSGTAGTGKTSMAAHFVDAACARGERCLYFSFEESPGQLIRNMRSIGLDLEKWTNKNVLQFHSSRASVYGLEMHLVAVHKLVDELQPRVVVLDPIGSLGHAGSDRDAAIMLVRLIDFLKVRGITAFLTDLSMAGTAQEATKVQVSSLVDTWLLLRDIELGGERNRAMYVLKSRGMAHSNQLREFLLTDHGVDLQDVYVGPEGVLTGSLRLSQEARERAEATLRRQEAERRKRNREWRREVLEARILAMRKEFEAEEEQSALEASYQAEREQTLAEDREKMALSRKAGEDGNVRGRARKIVRIRK